MAKIGKKAKNNKALNEYGISTASNSKRLLAYALDWAIGGIVTGLPAVFMYSIVTSRSDMFSNLYVFEALGYDKTYGIIAGFLCLMTAILYFIVIPLEKYPGQTLGKKIAKIKILTWSNENVSIKTLAVRYAITFIFESPLFIISTYIMQTLTLITRFYVESVWTFVGIACTLISAAMVIYTKKHCAVHDYVAKTKVVEVRENETTN